MEKIQIQPDIDIRSVLHNMAQMSVMELENFINEVNALIRRKKTEDKTSRDTALLYKINQTVLDKKKTERYHLLSYKLEAETMTDAEHAEFMRLATLEEKLRNQRVKYLIELSQLRAVSLPQLMVTLGLKSKNNG